MLSETISLALGYDVVIADSFAGLRRRLDALGLGRVVVVTNPLVAALHGRHLADELGECVAAWVELPDGEQFKTLETWQGAVKGILDARPDRKTAVLAFGGGVVGDIAGFAAAATLRGLPVVQVPTTLLSMVDSSVGGKTGVNTAHGKNLVGAFHQPRLVWAALDTLATLPARELRCGLGEVLKHTILESEEALTELELATTALASASPSALAPMVARSVRLKARIVEQDPQEQGVRATLNLGHTLGHAIERVAGYGEWSHGEAVALGVVAICRHALHRGLAADPALAGRVTSLAAGLGLPTVLPDSLATEALVEAMGFDKKRERGMVRLVIPLSAGNVQLLSVGQTDLVDLCAAARGSA